MGEKKIDKMEKVFVLHDENGEMRGMRACRHIDYK